MENHDPDDPVAVYISEVGSVKPLTKDEETKLLRELAAPPLGSSAGKCCKKIN